MSDKHSSAKVRALAESYFESNDFECQLLKGDGSDRRIYRITAKDNSPGSIIGIFHENLQENEDFFRLTHYLKNNEIPVPDFYLRSADQTAYLIQDLGPNTLAETIDIWKQSGQSRRIVPAYKTVLDHLLQIQQLPLDKTEDGPSLSKQMTDDTYFADLEYFAENFINPFGYTLLLTDSLKQELRTELIDVLMGLDHRYFVYRDFQSRNIMWFKNKPWFIDYQSAMKGSLYYDLASLLYGSKSGLNEEERERLIRYFFDISETGCTFEEFQTFLFRFVLIRRLRSLGTYGFLSLEKNKRHFLIAIPVTIGELDYLLSQKECLKSFPILRQTILQIKEKRL